MSDAGSDGAVRRPPGRVAGALLQWRHYRAAANMLRDYRRPFEMYGRYLFGSGRYPCRVEVRSPVGPLELTLYSQHDVLTLNEVFCRRDYPASRVDSVFVDFGSNIGISAAYFLSRGGKGFAYLFEPVPQNVERLEGNLRAFVGRYSVQTVAVGLQPGQVEFGLEETGRYGGIGRKTGNYITVNCLSANEVLENVISQRGHIDVLKIDIETLEREITEAIPIELASRISRIYVETEKPFRETPLAATHRCRRYGLVAQFYRTARTAHR